MPKIKLNDLDYGGSPTVEDADHLMVADTRNQTLSAQNIITNILGDMAQLEHNATASKAYAKGEYLVLGSYFYKATAAIAQGDTLVVGTNIEQTNVGAEMNIGTKEYKNGGITSPFTATHRGFLYFSILIQENSNVNISINGNNVINIGDYWTGNVTEVIIPCTLYVDVGDVVAWTINGSAALNYIRYVY